MRAGAYTIHQSLTAEAAAVLKLALALARRRGHAQVTPLHVAFALLTGPACEPLAAFSSSPASPPAPYGLLKRACLRSHPAPGAAPPHGHGPLHCRALELCFNVALNRLPASGPHSPPSSAAPFTSPLIQPSPTLSNALVAALKRAQANQRRGCVELQQPPPPPPANAQQQQPLLAIKVELDQLVISILDDPSVSRVMREAGFSSATVKNNLEEESALMPPPSSSPSPPPPPPISPHFFIDPSTASKGAGRFGLWPAQFSAPPPRGPAACNDDDVRAVLDVMVRKHGRRSNPVVVGDSVSMAEAVAGELLRRLERGDVPEELAGAHLLKLQLSYVHVRLMNRADVDARAAELRRSVDAVVQLQRGGGLVVYVGDLRWALDEEPNDSHAVSSAYSPVEQMVAELGRLLDDLRAARGRAWLVATASYQTYMRWQQRRRRPLDSAWALQAVVVPAGSGTGLGLALNSLHSSSSSSSSVASASAAPVPPAMVTIQQLGQNRFALAGEPTAFAARDEQDELQLVLCTECTKNYESEASLVKADADTEGPHASLPGWLVLNRPPADQTLHKKYLIELKRKWSRLCRKLHLCSDPCSPPCPWWSGSCLPPGGKSRPSVPGFLGLDGLMDQRKSRTGRWSPPSPSPAPRWGLRPPTAPGCHGVVGTALALGSHPLSDSATSASRAPGSGDGAVAVSELERRLRRNMPWQPGAVAAEIAQAVAAGGGKGVWLYVKGSDHTATRRAAMVIAATRCGSADRVIRGDPSRFSCAEELCSDVVSRAAEMGGKAVVIVDDVENAPCDVADCLVAASKSGSLKDHQSGQVLSLSGCVVILTASKLSGGAGDLISLRLWSEDETSPAALKRKTESESPRGECKRARHDAAVLGGLDLNLCAEDDPDDDDDDEAVPSDITDEGDSSDSSEHGQPHGLLEALAVCVVTLDKEGGGHDAATSIRARLGRAVGQGGVRVEETAVQALAAASGQFLEEDLESWTAEVLEPAVAVGKVKNGGKKVMVLGLGPGDGGRETAGFMGSALPSRVHVD